MAANFGRLDDYGSIKSSEQCLAKFKFIPYMAIGAVPIVQIEFDVFFRHESIPILMALQNLCVNSPQVVN